MITYAYNSADQLTSVTSFDGTVTHYTYATGSNPATENALTTIGLADGSLVNLSYNAAGQFSGYSQAGGADPVTYSYNLGEVTITDAARRRLKSITSMLTAIWSSSLIHSVISRSRPTTATAT